MIQLNKDTYDRLEVAQNTMGRWILGARKFCSNAAVRNELGWKSMRARIYTAKLKFWGKITFMKDSRWAKMIIKDIIETGWNSVWMSEISITVEVRLV